MLRGQLNDARAGLLDRLKEYQRIKKSQIRVVFDGKKDPALDVRSETIGTIDVYYSLDYSADFLIKQFIKKDLNPRSATVVTSDKDILFYVNRFSARTMTSEKFADHVTRTILRKRRPGTFLKRSTTPLFQMKRFRSGSACLKKRTRSKPVTAQASGRKTRTRPAPGSPSNASRGRRPCFLLPRRPAHTRPSHHEAPFSRSASICVCGGGTIAVAGAVSEKDRRVFKSGGKLKDIDLFFPALAVQFIGAVHGDEEPVVPERSGIIIAGKSGSGAEKLRVL